MLRSPVCWRLSIESWHHITVSAGMVIRRVSCAGIRVAARYARRSAEIECGHCAWSLRRIAGATASAQASCEIVVQAPASRLCHGSVEAVRDLRASTVGRTRGSGPFWTAQGGSRFVRGPVKRRSRSKSRCKSHPSSRRGTVADTPAVAADAQPGVGGTGVTVNDST